MSSEKFESRCTINRRDFLGAVIIGGAALAAGPLAWTKNGWAQDSIVLPELPYAQDALEPAISEQTIELHYGKHHAGYVRNTNKLLQGSGLEGKDLETIIIKSSQDDNSRELFNNAAQVWNHSFYWHSMRPDGGQLPADPLKKRVEADYGNFKALKASLAEKATSQFASGWAWLVLKNGTLSCINTANAQTPIAMGITPLLCIDVWEHAYYLDYQNRRGDYVQNFLEHVVNWDFANENLQKVL
ncbi:MAG: superoxide dismutase [Desulfohalobiaceae bacterium]